jgi:general secretion pathway protein C
LVVAIGLLAAVRWFYAGDTGNDGDAGDAVAAWSEPEASAPIVEAKPTPPPTATASPRAELRLLSTSISREPAKSTATLLLGIGGSRRALRVGDTLADDSVMEWVEPRRVGFRSGSERWTLELSPEPPPTQRNVMPGVAAEDLLRPPALDADGGGNRPLLDMYRDDPGRVNLVNLLSEADFSFRFDESNGDILGMTIGQIPRDSAYAQLGFESGDILLSVNGIQIDSPEAAESAFAEMERSSEIRIRLERGERTEEISVSRIVTAESLEEDTSS